VEALRRFARLVSPQGKVFIDVNHRYNARHYGMLATAGRFLHDRLSAAGRHGDVQVTWNIAGYVCATSGHVFIKPEFATLCRAAGLRIEKRFIVDYATGALQRWIFAGHLLYMLRRSLY
jgi:hypothetical protein